MDDVTENSLDRDFARHRPCPHVSKSASIYGKDDPQDTLTASRLSDRIIIHNIPPHTVKIVYTCVDAEVIPLSISSGPPFKCIRRATTIREGLAIHVTHYRRHTTTATLDLKAGRQVSRISIENLVDIGKSYPRHVDDYDLLPNQVVPASWALVAWATAMEVDYIEQFARRRRRHRSYVIDNWLHTPRRLSADLKADDDATSCHEYASCRQQYNFSHNCISR